MAMQPGDTSAPERYNRFQWTHCSDCSECFCPFFLIKISLSLGDVSILVVTEIHLLKEENISPPNSLT